MKFSRPLLVFAAILAAIFCIVIASGWLNSSGRGGPPPTVSTQAPAAEEPGNAAKAKAAMPNAEKGTLPGFDRRERKSGAGREQAQQLAREERRKAAERLQAMVPGARVDFDELLGSPKFVASGQHFLTGADGQGGGVPGARAAEFAMDDSHRGVKGFLAEHAALFGHGPEVLADSAMARDYVTPHNGLRTTVWQQMVDGVRVFESTLQAHVTNTGALVNVASRLVPDPRAAAETGSPGAAQILSKPPVDARQAISAAAATLGEKVPAERVVASTQAEGASRKQQFRAPALLDLAAEYTWLPLDEGAMRLCWEVIFMSKQRGEMFRTLVDAGTGEALVQQRLTEYISPASYRVFTSDSPSPMSPGHPTPLTAQPPVVARQLITLDALNTTASPNGWIDDGVNETRGNNVDAHLDINADNVADTPRPQGTGPGRVFDPPLDLALAPSASRDAAVVNLFYWNNLIHDRFYALGFTEGAGNFQINNFGRGGIGNDAVQADAQDGSGTNNANFSTPPDGSPGRMQMYVFTGPTPDRDGDFDQEIVIHEYTHGLSNRLVGGGVGMSASQSRGMGEGWSDFYGLCLLSEPGDDVNGTYAAGGYATYELSGLTQNYYFGIRRYPYSTDLAKNPLTFKDIDPTQASAHTGVPKSPRSGSTADQVHAQGEVWCVTLWQARANLIAKHGAAAGNDLILKLVTDGMKLAPANPNFLQARDGILQAEMVYTGGANRGELWTAFAKRGMGANATSPASSTTIGLVENYDIPDSLGVSPNVAAAPSGTIGGPFTPASTNYLLTNSGAAAFTWTATDDQPWLDLSLASGTLAQGENATVTATLNNTAKGLTAGTYTATIVFTNTTSGLAQQRVVRLTVEPFMETLFTENFEAPTLPAQWTITGTSTHRTLVTTGNGPRSGAQHLTMDSSSDGNYARNEATLTLDFAGRSNLTLRFWVKTFSDEPNGPPPSPFPAAGADFDGVAVSTDGGVNWFEIQGLRALTGAWQQFSVDLDAALAARGLSYTNNFKIRFNHYDNYAIATDGFAFDDISISRIYSQSLALVLPSTLNESAAPANATLTVTPPPVSDLNVALASSRPDSLAVPATVLVPAGQASVTFPVTPADDALLNGSRLVTITASASTFPDGTGATELQDNETAIISLALPTSTSEGTTDFSGTITLSAPVDADVNVALSSDDTGELAPPPFVTMPAGQSSATFPVTVMDDTRIDGTRVATITASVANWTPATASVSVLDNETTTLTLTLPATAREGDTPRTGTARISGTLATPLEVTLASNDMTEATVPGTVTIPAGQTFANFAIAIVDDTDADGAQSVTITASTAGFTGASGTFTVSDNDAHHFTLAPIPASVLRNAAVSVTATARDLNGAVITNYNQAVNLSAADSAGAPVPVTPATATGFINGEYTLNVSLGAYGTGVVLTVSDSGGRIGTSNAFDVGHGPMTGFAWNTIPSLQYVDAPFPVTVRAVDALGNTIPDYTGAADLSIPLSSQVQILTWTAFADLSSSGEYANTKAAIASTFPNFSETTTTTTDPATLATLLSGKQVFLIVEQESSSSTTLGTIGTSWASVLTNFVNSGGTVIACSHTTAEHLLLTNSGLLNVTPIATHTSFSVTKPASTPLNEGVATPFTASWLHTYSTTNGAISLQVSSTEAVVISRDIGAGRVILIGTDYYALGTGMDRVIANAVALAAPTGGGSLPVAPAMTGSFVGGEWSGTVSLPFALSGAKLRATAGAFTGDSGSFGVIAATLTATPATVFSEDFESGALNPAIWAITGTGTYRTVASNTNAPRGGSWHMTMDEATGSGNFARNEATLTVDLAGRSGAQLTFWAKMFGDEPHGPPAAPFNGGADFDGVAMSANGSTWWEVQSLRSPVVSGTWAKFTVDLDAAIAARGVAYNGTFKIRFNQYDDFSITTDGIAVDDIVITATALGDGLTVTLPAQAMEGAGVLSGSVSLATAPAADTVLNLVSKSTAKVTVPATVTIPAGQTTAEFPFTVLDDAFVDGTKTVIIVTSGSGIAESGAAIQIIDNDAGTLSLSAPASATEGAAGLTATLNLSLPSLVPMAVSLTSAKVSAVQVPATVTLARGQTSLTIPLTFPNNNFIEGDQSVSFTAAATGWTPAGATVQVLDDESAILTVAVPPSLREGDGPKSGTVSISGILYSDLIVALGSSDATAAAVSPSVTIPAGQSAAAFVITAVDDLVADGHQPFTITASAAEFTSGAANGITRDNEAHHFAFEPIGNPQLANGPVPAIITARDPLDAVIVDYNSPITLTATSDAGIRAITPSSASGFINGAWNGSVQIDGPATNVVITASDGAGHTGTSNAFDLVEGSLSHFTWDPIASPQTLDTPFNVTVRAVDAAGATVTGYNGVANLSVLAPSQGGTVGSATGSVTQTIYTYSHDSRSNSLYKASELGGAARITGLAFNVTSASSAEALTNLTIRLKHTALTSLGSVTSWDNSGWTQVYRASPTISAAGWVTFNFTTPFDYNGASNLLVDISIDRASSNFSYLYLQSSSPAETATIYGTSNSTNGDPLTWAGSTPFPNAYYQRADVRLSTERPIALRPNASGAFSSGVWSGQVSVPIAGAALTLKAQAGAAAGLSSAINVAAPPPPATGGATILAENFESGALNPAVWTITGTGAYRTIASNVNAPRGGSWHMTMDQANDGGSYARNQATLTVNLAGRSGARLTFWAKMFNDEAHGPPAAPFIGGADFDGVAISADGNTWWEVQPLRSPVISGTWAQLTVDLDAAIAARGIAYNGTFQIRFNQYDDFSITTDGIAIDDILITANPIAGFTLTGPAQVTEGAGATVATITLDTVAASDTTIVLSSSAPAKITVPASVTIPAGQMSAPFTFTVLNDSITDGNRDVAIAGTLAAQSRALIVTVLDNDPLPLGLIAPATMAENATGQTGTVTLGAAPSGIVTVALASSDPTAFTVPPSVIFQPGQTAVSFSITPVNDTKIDGTQTATITARVADWVDATATILVMDDEARTIFLSVPSSVYEGQTGSCTVSLTGTLPTPLVVDLSSSNPGQLTVPASVTVPAGQVSATFAMTPVNDSDHDGAQSVTITATAATFTGASRPTSVLDNDVHHFTFNTVANQIRGQAFSVTINARDVNNLAISVFTGAVNLTAKAGGAPVAMTPPAANLNFGTGSATVTVNAMGTGITLHASDAAGNTGASNAFNVTAGTVNRFVWDPVPPVVTPHTPFAASISAQDAFGNVVTSYNGSAIITAAPPQRAIGTGTVASSQPFYTSAYESRAQCIYLASEVGPAGALTGLSLDVMSLPSVPMTRFTIRVKPTTLTSTQTWESTGWTTVYQSNLTVTNTGWVFLPFTTPFAYDGTSNLMVDFSFDNATSGTWGNVRATSTSTSRVLYSYSFGSSGDPLTWSGSTPSGYTTTYLPNARLRVQPANPLPLGNVTITSGTWSGQLSLTATGTGLVLFADAASGLTGQSNAFDSTAFAAMGITPETVVASSGDRGGPFAPLAHTFTVTNSGTGTMNWQVGSSVPWISLSTNGTALGPGASTTVTATLDAVALAALPSGVVNGALTFTNLTNGIGDATRAIDVNVVAFGELAVSGGSGAYTLTNAGDATLTWTLGSLPPWLEASAAGGTLAPGASVALTIAHNAVAAQLAPGHYEHTLAITAATGGRGSTNVIVVHDKGPAPAMVPEPAFTGGETNTLQWSAIAGAEAYEVQAASSPDFAGAQSSGWIPGAAHTFAGLANGQSHYFRARARAVMPTMHAWAQSTPAELGAGTATNVNTGGAGMVLKSNPGGPVTGRILNPGFEADPVQASGVTAWTRTVSGAMQTSISNYTNPAPLPTEGTRYLTLWTDWSSHTAGEWIRVSQTVDFTGTTSLLFDVGLTKASAYPWANAIEAAVYIDGVKVWSRATEGTVLDQSVDVSALTGLHEVSLGNNVLAGGSYGAQWACFDNLRLTGAAAGYAANGALVSPTVTATAAGWGQLLFDAETPAGTELTVDILSASNDVLAANVANGADLGAIPALAGRDALRLRANLSTTNAALTPRLRNWAVTWATAATAGTVGDWSDIATSVQDASAPALTRNVPITTTSAILIPSGGATDFASGVASVLVDGKAVATSDAFATWAAPPLLLVPGNNTITVVGSDRAVPPNIRTEQWEINYTGPPTTDADGDGLPDDWEYAHGLNPADAAPADGALGDRDRDGISNLLEYAFDSDPNAASRACLPIGEAKINPADGKLYLEFTYRRRVGATGVTYAVETSASGFTWTSDPAAYQQIGPAVAVEDSAVESVTIRALPAIGTPEKPARFARLRVTAP